MSIRDLAKIFRPQRIAVIGASDKIGSVGYTVFRNLISSGFGGVVFPVNAKRESVQGVQAYESVGRLPRQADLAVICTPAPTVPGLVRECGEAGIGGLVILSAGFREIGDEGRALEGQIRAEAKRFAGMRLIGPNCLGVIAPGIGLNASFAGATPKPGHVAFISQSGALCTSVLDWAIKEDIGFAYFVSIGNMLDVSFGDLIDYFGEDAQTRAVLLYVESVTDARRFMSSARAFARSKPIIGYKSGRFAESAKAASSHTGALAGEDDVYDAAFRRAGVVRVFAVDNMFDCAELLGRYRAPTGRRLAIITNAGGPGVMATDALLARHGTLARLSQNTLDQLDATLPPFWSHGNPVDVLGDAPPDRFAAALKIVLKDETVDAVLVILTPQAMTDPTGTARAIANAVSGAAKPLLAAWMGGRSVEAGIDILNRAGVPTYATPEQGVEAFMYLVAYARNLETLYETPREVRFSNPVDRARIREVFESVRDAGHDVLSEELSKALLEAYEIPASKPHDARSADEAVGVARRIGFPVVLKVLSPQLTHKTDVGGVVLDIRSEDEVRAAFDRIIETAANRRPDAQILGVTVQRMISTQQGVELILGAKKDPTFGSVIMIGAGGVTAELFRDRVLCLPPLNERLTRQSLEGLKSWPLLAGYRGRPPANIDRLVEIMMRFSYLVADFPAVKELDINPLLVTPTDVVALDARVVIDRGATGEPHKPYAHLAIRPYPEEYVRAVKLKDDRQITLRPIKPEDEPMWHELLANCSPETIYSRFFSYLKGTTHEMAVRYCFIDYDRELAIVAEGALDGKPSLLGVGRLVADPDHESAEYAVLVVDALQGKGLGGILTDYCLEIARSWGIKNVIAETMPVNTRMLSIFTRLGFTIRHEENMVVAEKQL